MPRKCEWLSRIPVALELLRDFPAPVVDRRCLEEVLGIHRRVAIRLMHRFGGYQAGRTFLIRRERLISELRLVAESDNYEREQARWVRVGNELSELRRVHKGRQIAVPPPRPDFDSRIRLEPGRLEIRFETAVELLQSLVELARAVSEDFDAIQARIETKAKFVPILPE